MFAYGANQFLRLGGNLVLTRLLFPEAFGLMAIVQTVLSGIGMLSDVGIEQSIIQNSRGDIPAFVNTAWTLKLLRGAVMWITSWLLATPIAFFYGEPMLSELLPVVGLTALIAGFSSTKIATADRNLEIARVTIIDIGSSVFGLAITLAWALIDRTIWSLVIGSIASTVIRTVASHYCIDGTKNRLSLDRESVIELLSFGRWIFVSTALTFLAGEGNRLLIGRLLDVRMLAFFSLALAIAYMPRAFFVGFGGRILFSAYSEVIRDRPENLNATLMKARLALIVPYWSACAFLAYFSQPLINIMYDERYRDAAWMLQQIALGELVICVMVSYGGVLWAKGLVRTSTVLLAIQVFIQVLAMTIGSYTGGAKGLVMAFALSSWLLYLAHAFVYARHSLWQPKIDLPVVGLSFLVTISVLYNHAP
jgi:O-antigen/teichoic acid export membrane protein